MRPGRFLPTGRHHRAVSHRREDYEPVGPKRGFWWKEAQGSPVAVVAVRAAPVAVFASSRRRTSSASKPRHGPTGERRVDGRHDVQGGKARATAKSLTRPSRCWSAPRGRSSSARSTSSHRSGERPRAAARDTGRVARPAAYARRTTRKSSARTTPTRWTRQRPRGRAQGWTVWRRPRRLRGSTTRRRRSLARTTQTR